jgi:hypothetical protein
MQDRADLEGQIKKFLREDEAPYAALVSPSLKSAPESSSG